MPLPFTKLYGKTSANLYSKAFSQHMQAKKAFESAADTYFMANDAASYDDWKRARAHWNYFCMFPHFTCAGCLAGAFFIAVCACFYALAHYPVHTFWSLRSSVFWVSFICLWFAVPLAASIVFPPAFPSSFCRPLSNTDPFGADDRK